MKLVTLDKNLTINGDNTNTILGNDTKTVSNIKVLNINNSSENAYTINTINGGFNVNSNNININSVNNIILTSGTNDPNYIKIDNNKVYINKDLQVNGTS